MIEDITAFCNGLYHPLKTNPPKDIKERFELLKHICFMSLKREGP